MSNPRDWFRRRRRADLDVIPREPVDPFENGPTLELGRATVPGDEREPALRVAGGPASGPRLVDEAPPGRAVIPPPPPREGASLRDKIIEPTAFAARPQVVPMPMPTPARAAEAVRVEARAEPAPTPGFSVRRHAVPLA